MMENSPQNEKKHITTTLRRIQAPILNCWPDAISTITNRQFFSPSSETELGTVIHYERIFSSSIVSATASVSHTRCCMLATCARAHAHMNGRDGRTSDGLTLRKVGIRGART